MPLEDVSASLKRFITASDPQVIALSGKWGSGKTYFWNQFLASTSSLVQGRYNKYSYVSCFGTTSIAELRDGIFENAIPLERIGSGVSAQTLLANTEDVMPNSDPDPRFYQRVLGVFFNSESKTRKYSSLLQTIPWLDRFGPLYRAAAFLSVRKYLVCIDDVERRSAGLSIRDMLGLISALREQRQCSVIVILNSDAFDESELEEFSKFREKSFDYEIIFRPTASECTKIAFVEKTKYQDEAFKQCVKLGLTNIRVMRRIRQVIETFYPHIEHLDDSLLRQVVHSGVLLTWAFNTKDDLVPSYDYIKKLNFGRFLDLGEDKMPENQRQWNELLSSYGYQETDELDLQICHFLETGSLDLSGLQEVIKRANEKAVQKNLTDAFSAAWGIFKNSFEDNEKFFVEKLEQSFRDGVRVVSLGDASATTKLLRELGYEANAETLMNLWIDIKKAEQPQALDLSEYPFYGELRDPIFVAAVSKAYAGTQELPPLEHVVRDMAEKESWSSRDEDVLFSATVDDYVSLFKKTHEENLPPLIAGCLRFQKFSNISDKQKAIVDKVKESLARIGSESKLNKLRVLRYGVTVEDKKK